MLLEDLFPWAHRDSIQRNNKKDEGFRIAKRLQELADSEHPEEIRPTTTEFPGVAAGRDRQL
jgi:hypothetical protein